MTNKSQNAAQSSTNRAKSIKSVVGSAVTSTGREVWYVTSDGKRSTLVTSESSAAAMDDAVVAYAGALKRLAKR